MIHTCDIIRINCWILQSYILKLYEIVYQCKIRLISLYDKSYAIILTSQWWNIILHNSGHGLNSRQYETICFTLKIGTLNGSSHSLCKQKVFYIQDIITIFIWNED